MMKKKKDFIDIDNPMKDLSVDKICDRNKESVKIYK